MHREHHVGKPGSQKVVIFFVVVVFVVVWVCRQLAHWFIYLNTLFPVGTTLWEGLRGIGLLEKVGLYFDVSKGHDILT